MCHLDEQTEFCPPVNDETNCCSFFDTWLPYPNVIKREWKSFTKPVKNVINQFPAKNNPYRETGKYYEIDKSLEAHPRV